MKTRKQRRKGFKSVRAKKTWSGRPPKPLTLTICGDGTEFEYEKVYDALGNTRLFRKLPEDV